MVSYAFLPHPHLNHDTQRPQDKSLPQPKLTQPPVSRPNRLPPRRPDRWWRNHRLRSHRQHPFRDRRLHRRRSVRAGRLQNCQQATLRRRARSSGQCCARRLQHSSRHQVSEDYADWTQCPGQFRNVDLCQCYGEGKEQVPLDGCFEFASSGWMDGMVWGLWRK